MKERADTIVFNGRVLTLEPGDEGRMGFVALAGDRIARVGPPEEMERWRGPGTTCLDAGGGAILPGFIDAHLHLLFLAEMAVQIDCSPGAVSSFADILDRIREKSRILPAGAWIRAAGYDDTKLAGTPINRSALDAAAPDHPVFIAHVSVHRGVTNSLGLARGGLTEETPDPPGGQLGRDPQGRLDGHLYEEAAFRYGLEALSSTADAVIPPLSPEEMRRGIGIAGARYLAAGITSVGEALATPAFLSACQQLRLREELPLRIYAMIPYKYLDAFAATGLRTGFGDEWLRLGAIKIIADGAIAGRTACLREPYGDPALGTGLLLLSPEEIRRRIDRAHGEGFQVAVHANGDGAIEIVLAAFEAALAKEPRPNHRHRIEHCSLTDEALLRRMAQMGLLAAPFGSYVWAHGEKLLAFYGADRVKRLFAHRDFLDHGIGLAGSTDNPCGPFEPLLAIQSCVTRRGQDGTLLGENQRISLTEALHMYTLGSAYASFEEHLKGSLRAGKLADITVLGADITQVPPDQIRHIPVRWTLVGGRIRHGA
jgi:predicted amidohydrolase YtcJ